MLKTCFDTAIIIPISIAIILFLLLSALAQDYVQFALANQTTTVIKNQLNNNSIPTSSSSTTNSNEVVILNFYDDDISQFTNAKPILDKYGFKVTFFIVCNWANSDNRSRMTWQEINQLYREGHDIESHSMTHKRLNKLSENALDYEVGQSKQCIHDHIGFMPTVFSPPHSIGWNNATVINTIAKYYDLSIGGFVTGPMFLHCDGWKQQHNGEQLQHLTQNDCRPYSDNGTLNYASRYDIKENAGAQGHSNDTLIFDRFANLVNRE